MQKNNGRELYHLSVMQHDYYNTEKSIIKYAEETGAFIIGTFYVVKNGKCNVEALQKAYKELLRRNQALRMRIVKTIFGPRQFFLEPDEMPEPQVRNFKGGIDEIKRYCARPSIPKLFATSPYLCTAEIWIDNNGEGGLLLWNHHICSDGYTIGYLLYSSLCELYSAYASGIEPEPAKKEYLFSDYLRYEKKNLKNKPLRQILACIKYFNHNFQKFDMPSKIFLDNPQPNSLSIQLTGNKYKDFLESCKKSGFSDNSISMAAVAAVTYAETGIERFLFTSQSHGRYTAAQKKTSGPLLRTLYIFCEFTTGNSIGDYVKEVSNSIFSSSMLRRYSDKEVSFYLLPSYIVSHKFPDSDDWMGFNNLRAYKADSNAAFAIENIEQPGMVDAFGVEMNDLENGIELICQYLIEVVSTEKAERLVRKLEKALDMIIYEPDKSVEEWIDEIRKVD